MQLNQYTTLATLFSVFLDDGARSWFHYQQTLQTVSGKYYFLYYKLFSVSVLFWLIATELDCISSNFSKYLQANTTFLNQILLICKSLYTALETLSPVSVFSGRQRQNMIDCICNKFCMKQFQVNTKIFSWIFLMLRRFTACDALFSVSFLFLMIALEFDCIPRNFFRRLFLVNITLFN